MSIPPKSPWRGCAANFAQPVGEEDVRAAQNLVETVYYFNCYLANPPLADIIYRSSEEEKDVIHHVFRWDITPFQQVFQNGFYARFQQGIPNNTYYDLNLYVNRGGGGGGGGRPLDSTKPAKHAFISTTLNVNWRPVIGALQTGREVQVYRYEINAPGGIWVAETLGNLYRYRYPAQDEVCFVAGVAPQYIRSAQLFIASREAGSQYVRWRKANNTIIVNGNYNPQSHPYRMLNIQRPVFDFVTENGSHMPLIIRVHRPKLDGLGREKISNNDCIAWYAGDVANAPTYINAAFRSSRRNEAYIFMKNEYVLLNYAPGTINDRIVYGPVLICDGYPSLVGTTFGEHGIDCAFDTDGNNAFIFSGNICALIDYAPGTANDKILCGPMTITAMFPFFKGTVFENGIDAAFRSSRGQEAYLFKGDQYARINYGCKKMVFNEGITQGFHGLRRTIFASGIEVAFASHRTDEAYIFKGDQYARIDFAPGTTNDYIKGGVKPIRPNWPSLRSILPRMNRGLDVHVHRHNPKQADRDHDEF